MTADVLAGLRADAVRRAPGVPALDDVIEAAGRQRLAAYYVYCALIAGVIGDDGLPPGRWPPQLAEPMRRMGLTRFAPRTLRGLDTELTPAEQATRRSPDRRAQFAECVARWINQGALGPLCGDADSVRVAASDDGHGFDLELLADGKVVGQCPAGDHWELAAQQLAGAPLGGDAGAAFGDTTAGKATHWLKEEGISHAVSTTVTVAVSLHPIGAAAGFGTRLVRSRIQAGRQEADAFHRLGEVLASLRAQADAELGPLPAPRT
jgi:hypothetical protein